MSDDIGVTVMSETSGPAYIVQVCEHGNAILALPLDGSAVIADWTRVRDLAREAHVGMKAGGSEHDIMTLALCALVWATANPGVKP